MQVAERSWSASAVHDSVQAVLRDPAFHRTLRRSLADRLMLWLAEWWTRVSRLLAHMPSMRSFGLALVALIVIFVVVRLVIAARQRDAGVVRHVTRRGSSATEDAWLQADRLAEAGHYEEAAHALYRGVLVALGRSERLRLEPSKTSGDYARELRRRGSAAHGPFRTFTRRFDIAVYGHGGCDADAFVALRELSTPFYANARAA